MARNSFQLASSTFLVTLLIFHNSRGLGVSSTFLTAEETRKGGAGRRRRAGGVVCGAKDCACAQVASSTQVMAMTRRVTAASAGRFRIKEEWNFVAECRKKGVPQALYCKNGFVDTSARLLEKIERNSLIKQSPLSKDRDKRSSAFVFELSGEHWRVSRRVPVAAAGGRCRAELTAVALREGVCPEPGLLVSSSEPGRAVPGGAAGSTWIRPRLDPGCTAFKTLGAAVFLQTFKINGCPHPSFLKKLMEPFTRLTPRSGWCLC